MILIEKIAKIGRKAAIGLVGAGALGGSFVGYGVGKKRGAKVERKYSRVRERLSFMGGRAYEKGKWPEFKARLKKHSGSRQK
ncbi:MAG: hypothetical protein V3W37_08585 [Candidatus Binatia bacterium]